MKNAITKQLDSQDLARMNDVTTQAGQIANEQPGSVTFEDHTARKANNTIRAR